MGVRNSIRNINFGIKTTAQEEPENFWTYNNGITALTRKISKKGKNYRIEGISIINGAQTTGSIGECSLEEAGKVKIVCRFVECTERKVLHNIIKYNNTQNAFRSSDQRSTDPVQRRLATELAAYKIAYVHRRSTTSNPRNAISAESAALFFLRLSRRPADGSGRRHDIFNLDSLYNHVFPKTCSAEHVLLVHCLGLAVDEVKAGLKSKVSRDEATRVEKMNYEVLKYSTSKLMLIAIMGCVAEEILQKKIADLYKWGFQPRVIKPDLGKLICPCKDAVEAVLPIIAGRVSNNAYEASRNFAALSELALQIATMINSGGEHIAMRFAQLKDTTTI